MCCAVDFPFRTPLPPLHFKVGGLMILVECKPAGRGQCRGSLPHVPFSIFYGFGRDEWAVPILITSIENQEGIKWIFSSNFREIEIDLSRLSNSKGLSTPSHVSVDPEDAAVVKAIEDWKRMNNITAMWKQNLFLGDIVQKVTSVGTLLTFKFSYVFAIVFARCSPTLKQEVVLVPCLTARGFLSAENLRMFLSLSPTSNIRKHAGSE